MNQSPENPVPSGAVDKSEPANLTIDISVLTEGFRVMAQDNKKMMAELIKFRSLYNDNQKLNEELKKYRQGALRQSKEDVLRSVAQIYTQYKKDVQNEKALKFILTDLKGLLEDNEVVFTKSEVGEVFDRKFMKTLTEYVVPTNYPEKDRTVAESVEPGYVFFGEPLMQELVKIYKYEAETNPLETQTDIPVQEGAQSAATVAMTDENTAPVETDAVLPCDGATEAVEPQPETKEA